MNKENKDKTPSNYYQHNGKKNNICNCYKIIILKKNQLINKHLGSI